MEQAALFLLTDASWSDGQRKKSVVSFTGIDELWLYLESYVEKMNKQSGFGVNTKTAFVYVWGLSAGAPLLLFFKLLLFHRKSIAGLCVIGIPCF